MNPTSRPAISRPPSLEGPAYEVRFTSLSGGVDLVFPSDAEGHVDVDHLTARGRDNYLRARALIGRDYSLPAVCRTAEPRA
jgi:hypothetical protein